MTYKKKSSLVDRFGSYLNHRPTFLYLQPIFIIHQFFDSWWSLFISSLSHLNISVNESQIFCTDFSKNLNLIQIRPLQTFGFWPQPQP